jgi:hypothetical protein
VLAGQYLTTAAGNPGTGGYAFAFSDSSGMAAPLGTATASVGMTAFCGCGTDDAQNPPSYSFYGGGVGVNLSQAMTTGSTMEAIAQSGTGVTYAVTSLPTNGLRVQVIDSGGTSYCFDATAKSGMIPWAMFNTKCYDTTPDGDALPTADMLTQLEFLVPSNTTANAAWDFCVTALSF